MKFDDCRHAIEPPRCDLALLRAKFQETRRCLPWSSNRRTSGVEKPAIEAQLALSRVYRVLPVRAQNCSEKNYSRFWVIGNAICIESEV